MLNLNEKKLSPIDRFGDRCNFEFIIQKCFNYHYRLNRTRIHCYFPLKILFDLPLIVTFLSTKNHNRLVDRYFIVSTRNLVRFEFSRGIGSSEDSRTKRLDRFAGFFGLQFSKTIHRLYRRRNFYVSPYIVQRRRSILRLYYRHALNGCFRGQGTRSRSFPADSSYIRHPDLFPLFSFSLSFPPCSVRIILPDVSYRCASSVTRFPAFFLFRSETFVSSSFLNCSLRPPP